MKPKPQDQSCIAASSRRKFLGQTAVVSAACLIPYHFASAQTRTKSKVERMQFALIGVGGNGTRTSPVGKEYADLIALCDVDSDHLESGNQLLCDGKAELYKDYREVLARDDIDIVQISTPDHWHTKILVEAMLAGKNAYCEKPLTLTIDEGKLIRRVQKETGRVVQVGTQQRSIFGLFVKALAMIADGRLGKLKHIDVGIDAGGWSPEIPAAAVPPALDWDRWLGPAPKVPHRVLEHPKKPGKPFTNGHTQFRWWYEFSGGKLTDWGAHHVDIAMLGIAAARQNNDPVSVEGPAEHDVEFVDGVPVQVNRYNTARAFNLNVKFANDDVDMSIRHDIDNGILFEGERGRIFVNRGKLVGKPVEELAANPLPKDALQKVYRNVPDDPSKLTDRPAHWANFINAIENNVLPASDVHSHMKMLNVCHLAGICCRLGRKIAWDQAKETIVGDDLAISMMRRPYRDGYAIELNK